MAGGGRRGGGLGGGCNPRDVCLVVTIAPSEDAAVRRYQMLTEACEAMLRQV